MASYRWEVRWLRFDKGESFEKVNAELAGAADGWEPFAAMQDGEGGWVLFVKKKVE